MNICKKKKKVYVNYKAEFTSAKNHTESCFCKLPIEPMITRIVRIHTSTLEM